MNELTFLDLSKNANHSLTQSRNHKIRHLPEKYISYSFKEYNSIFYTQVRY